MNEQRRLAGILSMGCMLLLEIGWAIVCLYGDIVRKVLPASVNLDIFYYAASIFLAFFSFIFFHYIFRKRISVSMPDSRKREMVLEWVIIIFLAVIGAVIFLYEKNVRYAPDEYMPWHDKKNVEWLLLLMSGLLLCQIRVLLKRENFCKVKKGNLWFLYIALAGIAGYAIYQPNSFNAYYNLYHGNAYFNSVYRVLHLQPYNGVNSGMYGFYGIILAPFVKICGGDFRACVLVLAVLTGISMLCYFYVLEHMTSNTYVKILGSIGIIAAITALRNTIHLQTYPHRILFAGIVLAWIVWKSRYKKSDKNAKIRCRLCSLILLSLAIVWNMETGLGCVLAFVGSEIVELLQKEAFGKKQFWKEAVLKLLWLPASLFGAFGFVEIYDFIVSGKFISPKDFLFPFIGNPYVQVLNLELEVFPSFWMLICAFMFIMIAVVLLSTDLCGNRKIEYAMVYEAACTIICAVDIVYYVNRSVRAALFMLIPLLLLMASGLIEYLQKKDIWNKDVIGNGILRGIAAFGMLFLVLTALLTCGNTLSLEIKREDNRDMTGVQSWANIMRDEIPENTLGIGIGVPELYSILGWDTGYYGIDIPDFLFATDEGKAHVYELLNQTELVFIEESSLQFIAECGEGAIDPFYENHQILGAYEFGAGTYLFYGRTEE